MTSPISGIICSTFFDHSTATIVFVIYINNSNMVDAREKDLQFMVLKHAWVCFNHRATLLILYYASKIISIIGHGYSMVLFYFLLCSHVKVIKIHLISEV